MRGYLADAGRDPDAFKVMFRVVPGEKDGPDEWIAEARRLQAVGVTHLNIWPSADIEAPDETGLKRVIEVLGVLRRELG